MSLLEESPLRKKTSIIVFKVRDVSGIVGGCFVTPTDDVGLRVLSDFRVMPKARGLGFGSSLLANVTSWADGSRVALLLNAQPYGVDKGMGLDLDSLRLFYDRAGFRWNAEWELFLRNPVISGQPSFSKIDP